MAQVRVKAVVKVKTRVRVMIEGRVMDILRVIIAIQGLGQGLNQCLGQAHAEVQAFGTRALRAPQRPFEPILNFF